VEVSVIYFKPPKFSVFHSTCLEGPREAMTFSQLVCWPRFESGTARTKNCDKLPGVRDRKKEIVCGMF
jgi:hypothetical protein